MGILGGIVGGALSMPALLPVLAPVWLGLTYFTGRTVYARSSGRRRTQLAELADRLAALAEAEIKENR
jgi:hypothetical protein